MSKTYIPEGYRSELDLYDTQTAIGSIKEIFIAHLSRALHLRRVTAPLFVDPATGLNDDLSGTERAVTFDIPGAGKDGQVVHGPPSVRIPGGPGALHRYERHPSG